MVANGALQNSRLANPSDQTGWPDSLDSTSKNFIFSEPLFRKGTRYSCLAPRAVRRLDIGQWIEKASGQPASTATALNSFSAILVLDTRPDIRRNEGKSHHDL